MKNLIVLATVMMSSTNVFAQACAIGSGSNMKSVKNAVTLSGCIAEAGKSAAEESIAKGNPQKIEFGYEMMDAPPGSKGPKPYKMTGEIILKPSVSAHHQIPANAIEKR